MVNMTRLQQFIEHSLGSPIRSENVVFRGLAGTSAWSVSGTGLTSIFTFQRISEAYYSSNSPLAVIFFIFYIYIYM